MTDTEMDNADRLFDAMNALCDEQPACDVVYALAMMYAKSLRDQDGIDIKEAAKSFGKAVALEMKYPRSRVNLATPHSSTNYPCPTCKKHVPSPCVARQNTVECPNLAQEFVSNAEPANRSTATATANVGDDRESMGSEPSMGIVTGGSDPTQSLTRPNRGSPDA